MTEAPVSYDAEKAGKIIGQTPNWMKTQARAGKIPFTRIGRQMRWTPSNSSRSSGPEAEAPARAGIPSPARRRAAADGPAALQARPQRRGIVA